MNHLNLSRQKLFLGDEQQKKIQTMTVGIIGLGGLGSACAHLLARMGVQHMIFLDNDTIADHNIARQHLYELADIGKAKVEVAKDKLSLINPELQIRVHSTTLHHVDQKDLLTEADILLDCTDNHTARRSIERVAKALSIPWIHAAVIQDKGVVVSFDPREDSFVLYDDIYKEKTETPCAEFGVVVTASTLIASLQVNIALQTLCNKEKKQFFLRYNGRDGTVLSYDIKK